MNILVIGCDQVGAALVRDLERIGHDISLIEKDPEQLKRLDSFDDYSFGGTALVGDPTDPDILKQGGVENCDAVAAVCEDDSVNLMAAQIAKNIFRREKVICRLRPAFAGALPQDLRAGHDLPHHPDRTGSVPCAGEVRFYPKIALRKVIRGINMKVCIAGGGRVGRYLAQSLLTNHHSVVIIEPIEAQCRMLADSLDIPVICGDSISVDTLRTADVGSCNAFVAVTGSDEDNLVACQIAKREFGVDRTVARASNPKNRELLHTLGVDTVVCGTDNLSHILEREIETDTIRQLLSLGGGTASLNEILLPENFKFAGKAIMDVPIPGDAILVSITRDTEFIIPHGNTVLLPWDRILVLTQDDTLHLLTDAWELNSK